MKNYKDIFFKLENTLREVSNLSNEQFNSNFGKFKYYENRELSDNDYYNILVEVVFYSGMNAATVSNKMPIIKDYFSDYEEVIYYNDSKLKEILNDPKMIKNKQKINACIKNAKVLSNLINEYGSFETYIEQFQPQKSFENLLLFKEELDYKFSFLGGITSYHFMTDVGLPVLKPDRVIKRIFKRLGLIEDTEQNLKTVIQGRKMALETKFPIRYIDICFVKYGQKGKDEIFGLNNGICLEKEPKCSICGIKEYCTFNKK